MLMLFASVSVHGLMDVHTSSPIGSRANDHEHVMLNHYIRVEEGAILYIDTIATINIDSVIVIVMVVRIYFLVSFNG